MKKIIFIISIVLFTVLVVSIPFLMSNNNSNLTVSKNRNNSCQDLTFDEMVFLISKEENRTEDEITHELVQNKLEMIRSLNLNEGTDALASLKEADYRKFTIPVPGIRSYDPKGIRIYFKSGSAENNSKTNMQILYVSFDDTDKHNRSSKKFNGNIYLNIIDDQTIDWIVNGDFYGSGVSQGARMQDKSSDQVFVSYSVKQAKNHFAYYNKTGRYYISN